MISDLEARRISSLWHGGGGTALYALSSTGAINTETNNEITDEIVSIVTAHNKRKLSNLLRYCETNGPRGPVDGWSTLTW